MMEKKTVRMRKPKPDHITFLFGVDVNGKDEFFIPAHAAKEVEERYGYEIIEEKKPRRKTKETE